MSHTHEEWSESNINHYQSAHSSRTKSERIRNEADTLMANCSSKTQRSQQEANNRLGSRIEDCNSWRADLQTELDNNIRENGLLKETKSELEHAIAETERPLRINMECIKNREARISIDLVKDEVENSLEREVENIKTYQQRMQKMLAKVNQQIETNHSMQDKLHGDLEHKDMALEIDRDCHEMHNDAIDIKHHDGVEEEDVSGSVPQSWAKFSKNNVEESQAGRAATRQLRYDVNNLINNAASDMSVHWNKTNRAFTDRISETQDAHRNLKSNLILTKNEIAEMERYIERIKQNIASKDPPLRVAQSRLKKRLRRPDVENCNDLAHSQLTAEVSELHNCIKHLEDKLQEANCSLCDLKKNKERLEANIKEINDMEKCIDRLKISVGSIHPPLKVAQSRLKKRLRRPDVELCNDEPHRHLTMEVKELQESIRLLENKLAESNNALADLMKNKERLEQNIREISEQEKYLERLKSNIAAKDPPLRVAQSRLKKRTRRPDVEACNDQPHQKLIEEVAEIAQSIKLLEDKLCEGNDALQDLLRNKQRLEKDIKVKKNTLLIDQQKCMSMRRSFPYNVVATRYY